MSFFGFGSNSKENKPPQQVPMGSVGLTAKIGKLTDTMKTSRQKVERQKVSVARLKSVVTKLTGSYESSVEVIIDLSHILKGYQAFLVELEQYFKSVNENFESQLADMKEIEDSTAKALSNVRSTVSKEVEMIKKLADDVAMPKLKDDVERLDSRLSEMTYLMSQPSPNPQAAMISGGGAGVLRQKKLQMRRKLKVRIHALADRLNKVGSKRK